MKQMLWPDRETRRSEKAEPGDKRVWLGWKLAPTLDLPALGPAGEAVGCRGEAGLQKKLEQRCGGEKPRQEQGWALCRRGTV